MWLYWTWLENKSGVTPTNMRQGLLEVVALDVLRSSDKCGEERCGGAEAPRWKPEGTTTQDWWISVGWTKKHVSFMSSLLSPMLFCATWRVAFWYSCIQSFHRCAWKGNKSSKQNLIHRRRLRFFKDRGPAWAQRVCREPFLVFCTQSIRKRTTGHDTYGMIQNLESNGSGSCLTR